MLPQPQRTPAGLAVTGCRWGISKRQVRELLHECRAQSAWRDDDTIRDFVMKFVKPRTEGRGMGLALLLNHESPQAVNLMISHSWDENALRFFEDLEAEVLEHEVLFVCFLALYQCEDGAGPSIAEQLGADIHRGPFAEVIDTLKPQGRLARFTMFVRPVRARGRMLVVTNEECAVYSRLWCVWEAYVAACAKVPTHFTYRGVLFDNETLSSRQAGCGNPEDERRIRAAILQLPVETRKDRSFVLGVALSILSMPLGSALAAIGLGIATAVLRHKKGPNKIANRLGLASGITGSSSFLVFLLFILFRKKIYAGSLRLSQQIDKSDGYDRLDVVVTETSLCFQRSRNRILQRLASREKRKSKSLPRLAA